MTMDFVWNGRNASFQTLYVAGRARHLMANDTFPVLHELTGSGVGFSPK